MGACLLPVAGASSPARSRRFGCPADLAHQGLGRWRRQKRSGDPQCRREPAAPLALAHGRGLRRSVCRGEPVASSTSKGHARLYTLLRLTRIALLVLRGFGGTLSTRSSLPHFGSQANAFGDLPAAGWRSLWYQGILMRYRVALHCSAEGFNGWVSGLPGCCSQGTTEEEASTNITDAIREYLAAVSEPFDRSEGVELREVEVPE